MSRNLTQDNRQLREFLSVLTSSIDNLGIMQTTQILKKARNSTTINTDLAHATYIVAEIFQLAPDALFGKSRKYPRKYAFAIWAFIASADLNYSLKDTSLYCKASESTLSKNIKFAREFPEKTKFEKDIKLKFNQCRERIKEQIVNKYSK